MRKRTLPTAQPDPRGAPASAKHGSLTTLVVALGLACMTAASLRAGNDRPNATSPEVATESRGSTKATSSLAGALGIHFIDGSSSTVIVEHNGKKYAVDLANQTIREAGSSDQPPAHLQKVAMALPSSENTQLGAKIFVGKCSICHDKDGTGIASVGTPDFTSPKVQTSLTDDTIVATIRHGKKGTLMPAWDGKLSDAEIAAVSSFVRSLGSGDHLQQMAAASAAKEKAKVYEPPDDYLYSLPTGRRLERHGFYVNFTHRFAFDPAFSGKARGAVLFGLDGFAVPSFGFRYGVTDKLSVGVYRSPSIIGRPIEMMADYHLLDEHDGYPLNASFRFSVDGQGNFSKNFTTNFEGIFSRSLFRRAQIYVVPTLSLQNRRLISNGILENPPPDLPGFNSFSLGIGGALDIRPTVALIAEVMPTLANGRELGIHRPAYAFGIQKRLWRHAFTLGFSNSPGTVVSQRAGTRATFLNDPSADTPSGLFIGFDLMRQIY